MMLLGLGSNRRTRGIDVRPCRRGVTRAVDASVLARMGMVGSRALYDRVRLSHTALVSPLTTSGRLSIRLRKDPGHFPRAPGKRISGQMARFMVFQKQKPGPNPTGLPFCAALEIRQQAAVQFQPVSLVQTDQ